MRPRSTVLNPATTRQLVGSLEWVGLLVQAVAILRTGQIDKIGPGAWWILGPAAVLHLLAAVVAARRGGPFSSGGPWLALWLGTALLVPLVMAHLVGPIEYGSSPACAQLCGYPTPIVIMLAFYPWWGSRPWLRWPGVGVALVVVALEPFLLIWLLHDFMNAANWQAVVSTGLAGWTALAFGLAVGWLCRQAVALQQEEQAKSYRYVVGWVHSQIKSRLGLLRTALHNASAEAQERLEDLRTAVESGNLEQLLALKEVPLAALVAVWVGNFRESLGIEAPPVGPLTLIGDVALLVHRAVPDLLSNAQRHARPPARLDIAVEDSTLIVSVSDSGTGFNDHVLEDERSSLHALRLSARELDGDVVRTDAHPTGSVVTLRVSLQGRHRSRRGR